MDKTVDFSNCKRVHTAYGGTDRKFGVTYNNETYMLKFSENHAKKEDISTCFVNNAVSEYLSSHIAQSAGLPVHETVLGTYRDELVVGCKDFRGNTPSVSIEFSEYVRARSYSSELNRIIKLDQIYETISDPQNDIPIKLQRALIRRYWDTFVIDALVGNFDRHSGNWGFISKNNTIDLSPAYDFGSTLFPNLSDDGMAEILNSPYELLTRTLVFPSASLSVADDKIRKVSYYEMMASGHDPNCTQAVLRMVPKIDMLTINQIVDDTPFITDIRKSFYKAILKLRFELILNRAYIRCYLQDFDEEAKMRLLTGISFSENDLKSFLSERTSAEPSFQSLEPTVQKVLSSIQTSANGSNDYDQDSYSVLKDQINLIEKYGFQSSSLAETLEAYSLFNQEQTNDFNEFGPKLHQ